MEAETITTSDICQELFPIMDITQELRNAVALETDDLTRMHVSVYLQRKFCSIDAGWVNSASALPKASIM